MRCQQKSNRPSLHFEFIIITITNIFSVRSIHKVLLRILSLDGDCD